MRVARQPVLGVAVVDHVRHRRPDPGHQLVPQPGELLRIELADETLGEHAHAVAVAGGAPGCFGARLTGAGFAGCAIALVERRAVALDQRQRPRQDEDLVIAERVGCGRELDASARRQLGPSSILVDVMYARGVAVARQDRALFLRHLDAALAADLAGDAPEAACKPFDRMRRGLVLAEGGGALVLEALDQARARGAAILGEVIGYGSSQDAFDLNRPPPDGLGAELCMRRALDDAGLPPDRIGAVNAHGTGTRAGDPAEAVALRRVLGERWRTTPVSSIKGAIGHAMAAAGAMQGIAAVRSCATGAVPPTCNLTEPDDDCELDHVIGRARETDARAIMSCSYGMGAQNAGVIFARPAELG